MSGRGANLRLLVFAGVLVLLFVFFFGRIFHLQVVSAADLRSRGTDQHVRTVELKPRRGVIYDREGSELAVSVRTATICATPPLVEDSAATAEKLAAVLEIPAEELRPKLEEDTAFTFLARKLPVEIGEEVNDLAVPGIRVVSEDKRMYPKGKLAPQVLGYVGTDNVGLAGVERQYDDLLAGRSGLRTVVHDNLGRSLDVLSDQEAEQGRSLMLTLDEDIQYEVERVLERVMDEFSAQWATAIVMDPESGSILAMANAPLFDTNDFGSVVQDMQRNYAVTDQFEPGSTFKVVTVGSALESGLVNPQTTFSLAPEITVSDRTIHEARKDLPDVRELTVTEILAQSSNVGTVTLGLELGRDRLVETIRDFGFTQPVGIDFPGEAEGMMLSPDEWSGATIANVPIGQGISTTALQIASAYAGIANDGVIVQPHLASDGNAHPTHRVISAEVARELRKMLSVAVYEGTGASAAVPGYRVAGKTGTAQKVKEGGGGYAGDKFVASFVGMVPADDPELVILVAVDEPKPHYGSVVAAPAFAEIARFALTHLEIPPARDGSAGS